MFFFVLFSQAAEASLTRGQTIYLKNCGYILVAKFKHLVANLSVSNIRANLLQTAVPGPEHGRHQWPLPGDAPLQLRHDQEPLSGERGGQ